MADIDLFKTVNDTFGHLTGDRVLRRVATLLRQGLPPDGFYARYGGEEFVLVRPMTAIGMVELARARIAEYPWSEFCPGRTVTVSIGLAREPGDGRDRLLEADDLLYAAKHAGRNRVAYRERGNVRPVEHCP